MYHISSLYVPEIPTFNSIWFKGNDEDTYTIRYSSEQDLRDDKRIYEALKGLGKIIEK